jgi:hypothetical protein
LRSQAHRLSTCEDNEGWFRSRPSLYQAARTEFEELADFKLEGSLSPDSDCVAVRTCEDAALAAVSFSIERGWMRGAG